ncbi:protein with signal peptide plus possible GPI signal or transmembrane domain at C-terminus [Cryptosporidium felis]|nr:protein with signal peptide plus possible GPI signal or transmembrane domain at C-terminus [Cryptosporidium felis]
MRLKIFILIFVLIPGFSSINGIRLKQMYNGYSETAETEKNGYSGGSESELSESGATSRMFGSNVSSKRAQANNGPLSQIDSDADEGEERDEDEDIESSERGSKMTSSKKYSESENDDDEEVQPSSGRGISVANAEDTRADTSLPRQQYMARQQRFNLASTLYPASDVSSTNYVFLSPAAQRRIDRKITKLQREGGRHGSMKETRAIGEWQRRYYSRPATEYEEVRTASQGGTSILTWVILGLGILLLALLCACGARFLTKE